MRSHLLCCYALGVFLVGMTWNLRLHSQPPTNTSLAKELTQRGQYLGSGSCAAAACHNADALTGFRGREFALAFQRDPQGQTRDRHAQAYQVLFSPRSLTMVRNWRRLPHDQPAHPEKEVLCLRCHVHPEVETLSTRFSEEFRAFRLEDGVSCEACHGPAENWLASHFRPGFRSLSSAERTSQGMNETRSLVSRVQLCVDCHVGTPGMEVNHDLIAAGHPRLNFEFSGLHVLWHKHWDYGRDINPALDSRGRTDFEVRAWAVGQVVAARSSLQLLAARSQRATWPELAEYDCYRCHHDLKGSDRFTKPDRKLFTWSEWYVAQLPMAIEILKGQKDPEIAGKLRALKVMIEAKDTPRPGLPPSALQLAHLLEQYIPQGAEQEKVFPIDEVFRKVTQEASKRPLETWDDAAQAYLAVSALNRARHDAGRPTPSQPSLVELRRSLLFRPDRSNPEPFNSDHIRKLFQTLREKDGP